MMAVMIPLILVCYHPPLNLLYNGHQVSRTRVPLVAPNVSAFNSQPPHQPFMGLDTDWRIEVQSTFGQSVKDIQCPSVPSASNKNGFKFQLWCKNCGHLSQS